MEEPAKSKFELQKEKTHLALLNAAQALILERGTTRLSLEEIAQAAGVTRATLYHHFNGREEIVFDVLASFLERTIERIKDCVSDDAPVGVDTLCDLCLELWKSHFSDLTSLKEFEEARSDPRVQALHRDFNRTFAGLFAKLKSGESLRIRDAERSAKLLLGAFPALYEASTALKNRREYLEVSIRRLLFE